MILGDLPPGGIARLLAGEGLRIGIGHLVFSIRSSLPAIADALSLLYCEYPCPPVGGFVDFRVSVELTRSGIRPLAWAMIEFRCEGRRPFLPMAPAHAFPVLEWGLNWSVATTMHCWLIIHAAVLARDDRAVILPGRPGAGKSTLTAVLAERGWRLLSDEHAIIDPRSGLLLPSPRPIALKNESIRLIDSMFPDAVLSPSVLDTHKGEIAHLRVSQESVARATVPAHGAWVVFPQFSATGVTELVSVDQSETLVRLAENSFNFGVHGTVGFHALADLVSGCDCYRLPYASVADAARLLDCLG